MAERKQPATEAPKPQATPQAKTPRQPAPDRPKPVYATVRLLPNFQVGDRLDGQLLPDVLAVVLKNGDGSYDKPKA